jgi:pSer/pThr/pTyr-binding forkhead associated (FHA) protein
MEIVSTPYSKQSDLTEKDYLTNKSAKKSKQANKINNFIFTPITKNNNDNKINNNQNEFNCNCIGKDSYKNTEGITIINKNTNENNEIHTYSTTYGKTTDKNETLNNKTTNSKKTKNVNNYDDKDLIKENKTKNSFNSLSKRKTNEKTNPNIILEKNKANNISNESKKEKEKLCLDLEVLNSWNLPIGLQLHIDEFGLKNSIRNKGDGITYFGFQTEDSLNTEPYIDYLLGPKDQEYDEQFIGKHFQIRFDNETKKYYIKDLGNGFGTFIKLINEEKIKDNLLINIGETYIVFSFNNDNENELTIKLFTGDEQRNSYSFNCDNQKCIIIGRDSSLCDVIIDDKMLSRVHCCINYKEKENEKGWYIKDGNLQGKKSTNDTWFYSAEETLIYDKMIFKTNHNLFKCLCK